ncbi:30S ribosomal protein S4 [Candidatus Woesearchaeota archaeon]|nr:MAG: 30S ribosomal protein S4 [Candidatus Woesearchaeota archaeon]
MGDPKKHRKTYSTPSHPWNKERLDAEKSYVKSYGLVNKKEIYKAESMLRNIKSNAKRLLRSQAGPQRDKEHTEMMARLKNLGLLNDQSDDDSILSLQATDLFDRRLQSIVFRKGLASSMKQARQFIVHEHITIGDKKITSPSYLVPVTEEVKVSFAATSNFAKEDHPERKIQTAKIKKEIEMTKPKKDEKRLLDEDVVPEEDNQDLEVKVEETIEDIEDIKKAVEESEAEDSPAKETETEVVEK